jgi:nitrate reductase beta subunit
MKIRQGFVANSSSSSFVLAIKRLPDMDDSVVAAHLVLKYVYKMLLDTLETKADDVVRTKSEYDAFIMRKVWNSGKHESTLAALAYEMDDDDGAADLYAKRIKMLEDGFALYYLDIEHSDESLAEMLRAMSDGENITFTEDYL